MVDKLESLAKLRKEKKITQEQIAELLEIPQQQYSRYEIGKYDMPLSYFIKICKKYRLSADEALGLTTIEEHNSDNN